MFVQMLLGGGMVVVTTLVHGAFTVLGIERLGTYIDRHHTTSLIRLTLMLAIFVLWLFLAMIVEVWAWAHLYLALGALGSFEESLYFSTVTFTTLGYGDITLDKEWRLLSSFEAANGLLMFGWSAALIFAVVQWVYAGLKRGGLS